jgi:DNA-binding LacI/PurR family transcriptional regulator
MGACIAVASPNLFSSFTTYVYLQVKKQLRPDESMVHCVTDYQHDCDHTRQRLLGLLEHDPRPSALIAICLKPGPAVIEAYRAAGAPVIVVDEEAEGASTVAADGFACGRMAGEHLLQLGRRSIAIVSGRAGFDGGYGARHRQRGLRQALADSGLELPLEELIEVVDYSQQDGVSSMNTLLDRRRPIDAVFCAAGDTTPSACSRRPGRAG